MERDGVTAGLAKRGCSNSGQCSLGLQLGTADEKSSLAFREQLDQIGEHLIAILPTQRQGQLSRQQAVLDSYIITTAQELAGEITLASRKPGKRSGQVH